MKFNIKYVYRFVIVLMLSAPLALQAALPEFTGIVDAAKNSVVNISTKTKARRSDSAERPSIPNLPEGSPFGDLLEKFFNHENPERRRDSQSLGSGFVFSADGYILTNHHVIAGADEVIVRFSNREEYVASIVGSDEASDIAVLKIDAEGLPVLKFGDSDNLKVGEWVLAIGSPFGFDHSVTAGIVSAKGRSLPTDNYVPFIQTDVAINPGNSGGPLFNLDGEVVGINSQIYSRTGGFMGLSFAIPIELAVDVATQIRETGSVSRGWLGVLIQEVTRELAESFGMESPQGALVAKVLDNSPAAEAGLQVGDVIVEFNGKPVMRSSSLPPLVGRSAVGKDAEVTIIRDRTREQIKVRIAELPTMTQASFTPQEEDKPQQNSALGMSVTELSKSVRKKLKVQSGVQVTEVDEQGAARDAGIQEGDVIVMIDNQGVTSVKDFEVITDDLKVDKSVALLVQRRSGPVFLAIRPEDS
ncbi:MAG: DegQ family serine endoprotease [Gammaproteobacteria bacterium]|nr:DegQ family serine endoprotease [Gammaproteobacteria bacterium]MCZ6668993.1 DegQ family serine endoprotease [Gammaproteobacteria bacterium]